MLVRRFQNSNHMKAARLGVVTVQSDEAPRRKCGMIGGYFQTVTARDARLADLGRQRTERREAFNREVALGRHARITSSRP